MSIFRTKPQLPPVVTPTVIGTLDGTVPEPDYSALSQGVNKGIKKRVLKTALIPIAIAIMIVALITGIKVSRQVVKDGTFEQQAPINIVDVDKLPEILFSVSDDVVEIVFNNTIVANSSVVLSPNLQPTQSVEGQIYYDETSNEMKLYDGNTYQSVLALSEGQQVCFIGSDCGFLTDGDIPTSITLPQDLAVTANPTFANLSLSNDLFVSNGGTGASSFANNTVLIGNGTGSIGTTNTPASGQLLVTNASGLPQFVTISGDVTITSTGITSLAAGSVDTSELASTAVIAGTYGNGSDYPVITVDADGRITSASTLPLPGGGSGVGSLNTLVGALILQGTANQVNVASGGSTITLSAPQDIATSSSPTFNGLTVSSLSLGGDLITDITGTGLQVSAGLLQTTLGADIDGTEIANGSVANADLVNSSVTVSAGTGLSGGGAVSLGGTVTLSLANDFGASIDTGEISNATILFADIASNSCSSSDIIKWDGLAWTCASDAVGSGTNTFATISTPAGTSPVADSTTDILALAEGAGVTITGDSITDTVTVSAVLGTDISGTEIVDGTIEEVDLELTNAPTDNYILSYDSATGGFAWVDPATAGTPSSWAITDGVTSQTLSDGDTLTVTSGAGIDASISVADTLTIINTGDTDGADDVLLTTNFGGDVSGTYDNIQLGTGSVTSAEISNATILFADFAQNGCGNNEVIKWSTGSSAWICSSDSTSDADADPTNELQNLFATFAVPAGTSVVTDSNTDTFTFDNGSGVSITGDGTTDTVTIAAVLGTDISGTEIVDGTIEEVDFEVTNAAVDNYILTYDSATGGFTWVDPTTAGSSQNIFETFNAPNGTDPVADSTTDLINFTDGANIIITGTSVTDTIDIALSDSPTISGLVTLNGGLTIETGDTFTFNGDAFTDFTGTGLQIVSGSLQTTLGTTVDLASEITGTLGVGGGGTGATTTQGAINALSQLTTTGDILYYNGTNSTRLARGSSGDCLTSNGSTIVWTGCAAAAGGVSSINALTGATSILGTANQISVATSSPNITLSLPNSVILGQSTGSAGTLALYDGQTGGSENTGTLQVISTLGQNTTFTLPDPGSASADICLSTGNCVGGSGGGAPNSGEYVTYSANATLSAERVLSNGTNSNIDIATAGQIQIDVVDNPTFSGLVTLNGGLTVETGDTLIFNGDSFTDLTGTGLTVSSGVLQTTLGTDISGTEIVDNTIEEADIESTNSATDNYVLTFDSVSGGFTWVDPTSVGYDSSWILSDGVTTQTIDNGETFTVVAGAGIDVAVSATNTLTILNTGDTDGSDDVLLSTNFGGDVSGTYNNIQLGTGSVTTTEIANATILFADIASNSCSSNDIIQWNGSAWICGTDSTADADADPTNELQNLFATFAAPAGTSVVVDSNTDTFTFADGSGITITGDGTTDTITVAAVLGADISGTEIVDGTIEEVDFEVTNAAVDNYILTYDSATGGFTWVDPTTAGSSQNIFETFNAPNGTDPVADSTTDLINILDGTNVLVTGDSATDSITITVVDNPTFSGLLTANAGINIGASQLLSIGGDSIDDFVGTGLQLVSGDLQTTLGTSVDLSTEINGTLGVGNGGTGASTTQGAINAISQLTTNGDLLYNDGANSTRLARGSNGQCLVSNATTLEWVSCAGTGTTFFSIQGTSGISQSINGGDVVTIAAGTNISTTGSATDTITVEVISNPTFSGLVTANAGVSIGANQSLSITGGNTASRPGSPTEGMVYFDSDTDSLLTYANGKWQADRSVVTKIVAASNSSQSVKDAADYIATGTNDHTTINAALTAASGGKVYLSEGTYTIGGSISVPNNTTLAGAGRGTLITIPNSFNTAIDAITNTTTGGSGTGLVIQDLRLDGNKSNQASGVMNGIYFNGVGSGSGVTATQGGKINNVWSSNWRYYGVYLMSSSNNIIYNSISQANDRYGIVLFTSSNNNVASNTTQGNGSMGIYLFSTSSNNTITGNISQGNTNYGIDLYSSSNNTIVGNVVQTNGNKAIYLESSSNTNTISSNNIKDSGSFADNDSITISASDYNIITDNIITDSSCTSTCYSINIFDSTSDKNYFSGNRYSGSAANAASINDAGTNTIYEGQQVNSTTSTNSDVSDIRFRGSANSTTAFSVQNASSASVLNIDTTNGEVELGNASTAGKLVVSDGSSNTATLVFASSSADVTFQLPAASAGTYDICTTATVCSGYQAAGSYLTASLTDNITDALDFQEGTNNYININTTDATEEIQFGNTTTNPLYTFLGSGQLLVEGGLDIAGSTLYVDPNPYYPGDLAGTVLVNGSLHFSNTTPAIGSAGLVGGVTSEDPTSTPGDYYGADLYSLVYNNGNAQDYSSSTSVAVRGSSSLGAASTTLLNAIGLQGSAGITFNGTGSTITNAIALQALNPSVVTGSITNGYGLFVENQTSATNDYGIYVAGADTYALWVDSGATRLDGTLEVGNNTTLVGDLAVNGDDITSDGDLTITPAGGDVLFAGNILPNTNDTYDLGSDSLRFRDLYLGGETLNIGASIADQASISYLAATDTATLQSFGSINLNSGGANTRVTIESDGDVAFDSNTLFVDATNNKVALGTSSVNSSTSRLHVTGTATDVSYGRTSYLYSSLTSSTNTQAGTMFETEIAPGAASTQIYRGIINDLKVNSANVAGAELQGLRSSAYAWGTGNLSSLKGLVAKVQNDSTGTATQGAGLYIESAAANGILSSNYGVYVQNQTAGASDYGIYIENADTYALWVDSGATRLDGTLEVNNSLTATGSIRSNTGFNINGTAGASTTCAGGQVLQNQVVDGGITTGGSCTGVMVSSLVDNTVDSLDVQEGTNNYININTTNSSENISLGNATTNPSYSFQGSGNLTVGGNILSANSATANTGTTEAVARTNVTTVTLTGAVAAFADNDIIFINNAGQDYYTRITGGGGTASLTVSPAVSYDVSATVTEYQNVRNIGATNTDYTTQTQRFFQGYFLGGVVTGAGSTTLSDQSLMSTGSLYVKTNGENTRLTIDTSGNSTFSGSLTVTSTATLNGALTMGDAIGDTVTVNSGAWTFANDTTIALTGGVNGLNIDSNTLSVDATNNRIGIGTAAPSYTLDVRTTSADWTSIARSSYGKLLLNSTAAETDSAEALLFELEVDSSSSINYTGDYTAIWGKFDHRGTGNITGASQVRGVVGQVDNSSSGTIDRATGVYGGVFATGSSNILDARGVSGLAQNWGSGTITTYSGLWLDNAGGTGSVLNSRGVAIANQTKGSSSNTNLLVGQVTNPAGNWSIYNSSAYNNAFAGNLRIGSSVAPTVALDVTGSASISGSLKVSAVTGNVMGTSTDTTRALSILNSGMTAGNITYLTLGRANSANNQLELSFYYAGDGSSSNYAQLGLHTTPGILKVYGTGDSIFSGDLTVSGGNLGIGTAANSSYVLQAYYDSNTYAGFSNNDNGDFYISGSNADLYVVDDSNSLYYTRIHNNGSDGYIDTGGTSGDLYLRPGGNDIQFVGSGGTGKIYMGATNNMEFFAPGDALGALTLQNGRAVYVNVTAATGATHLCYSVFGRIEACTSSRTLKHDITDTVYGIDQLRQLRPVQYVWNASGEDDAGFIAEEVALVIPETTEWNTDGTVKSFDFDPIVSVLTKSVQQLDVQVQDIDARLSVIESGEFAGNLHVNGDAQFDGDLAVTGNTTLAKLTVIGDTEVQKLTVNGKIITAGAAPTAVLGAQATGQGATVTVAGNDTAGSITYASGTQNLPLNPLATGEQANVSFVTPFAVAPRIALTAKDAGSAAVRYYVETTTTGFKVHFLDIPSASTTYTFDYIVIQ